MGNGWYFCKKCDTKFCLDKLPEESIDDYWKRVRNTNRARCKKGHVCDPCNSCNERKNRL